MFGPKLETANGTLLFDSTGVLAIVTGDEEAARGRWRSNVDVGAAKENAFRYDIDGVEQTPIPAAYSFSDDNQLVVKLSDSGGATSDAFAYCGGIEVDDGHDVLYRLIDAAGDPTGATISVYGEFKFQQTTEDLVISTTGGADAIIQRVRGERSIDALENDVEFQPKDLLRFQAITFNTFSTGEAVPVRAVIDFVGQWNLRDNQLVFLSSIKGDLASPAVNLLFAGQIGAVKVGFEYKSGPDGTDVLLQLQGKHTFNSETSETTVTWNSSLGFSDKQFTAKLSGGSVTDFDGGGKLTLSGDFELSHQEDGAVAATMKLSLGARYEWANNVLIFKADISDDNGELNYNLQLNGTWKYAGHTLMFKIQYTNDSSQPDLHIELSLGADQESVVRMISFVLDITEGEATAKIEASFEIRLRWASGVPVKTIEAAAAA